MTEHAAAADPSLTALRGQPAGTTARQPGAGGRTLWLLLLVALMARLTAAIAVQQYVTAADRQFLIEGDANGYWELAGQLAAGRDYAIHTPPRYVLRTPGFPLLLAGVRWLFGDSLLAARCVLAFVGTLCCLLTFVLAQRMFTRRLALVATTWLALNPIHVGNSVLILSETWFACWMLVSLLGLHTLWKLPEQTDSPLRLGICGLLTGAAIGLTMLVRPGFLLWLPVSIVAVIVPRRLGQSGSLTHRVLATATLLTGFVLVVTPWAIRNQRVTGHLVLTSLWSGPSLYDGLNPAADGRSDMTFFDSDQVMSQMSEFEMNEHYKHKALDFALTQPGRALQLAFPKARQFLQPVPNSLANRGWVVWAACAALWLTLLTGLVLAAVARTPRLPQLLLTFGPFCLFLAVHMVFVGSVRYRLPLEFPLAILSASGWLAFVDGRVSPRTTTSQEDSPA